VESFHFFVKKFHAFAVVKHQSENVAGACEFTLVVCALAQSHLFCTQYNHVKANEKLRVHISVFKHVYSFSVLLPLRRLYAVDKEQHQIESVPQIELKYKDVAFSYFETSQLNAQGNFVCFPFWKEFPGYFKLFGSLKTRNINILFA
jgi:hypothetical protein